MRNLIICTLTFLMSYISSDVRAYSLNEIKSLPADSVDFETITLGWTTERFEQYRDSILSSVYAPIHILNSGDGASRAIEPTMLQRVASYDTIINSHVPNSVSIDTNKPVGDIPIYDGISQTGARTYEIPIKTSEGMHGFTPQISLSYNSQSPNSIAGVGWSVGGLSCITRGSKTMYYDGQTEEIKLNNSDAFYLDGMRLIQIATGNGVITYETELHNIVAKAHGTTDAIYYFEVFYPDGRKCIYGRTEDNENRLEYPMMSNSDIHGNTITYVYTFQNNHYNIFYVSYNGGYSILFGYELSRPDTIQAYRAGLEISEPRRLSRITCKYGTNIQRQYLLDYTIQNQVSLLTELDYTEGNVSPNPLRFYYGEDLALTNYSQVNATIYSNYYQISDPNQVITLQGKFDYHNGDDGIIVYPNSEPYWRQYQSASQNCFQNQYTTTDYIFVYGGLMGETSIQSSAITLGEGFVDVICADFEGAGYDQVVKINNRVVNGLDQVEFRVYKANTFGELQIDYTRIFTFPTVFTDNGGHQSIQPKLYLAGDYTGDGKMEILAVASHHPLKENDSRATKCYLIDLNGNQILYQGTPFMFSRTYWGTEQPNAESAERQSNKLVAMDYDGDGKTDFCHIAPNKTDIYSFEPSANGLVLRRKAEYTGITQMQLYFRRVMPCDFNGDGLCDLLVSPPTIGTSWTIHLSKGNGQFVTNDFTGPSMASNAHAFVRDVNGDGLADIISYNNSSFTTYLTNHNKVGNGILTTYYPSANSAFIPIDIQTHEKTAHLLSIKDNIVTKYNFPRNDAKEAMMTGMANSYGVVQKNAYNLLNEIDDNIDSNYPAFFPYTTTTTFLPVCRRSETFMNGDMTGWKNQRYTDAICHLQGLGFRCFYKMQNISSDGQSVTRTFAPDKYGAMVKEETFLGDYILNREFTYTSTVQSDKRAVIALSQKTEENYLTGVSSTSSYTNNTYGHPLTESTNYSDGISKQISYSYSSNPTVGDGYYIGYLTNQTVTTTRNGYTSTDRTQITSHNKCQPLEKKTYKNNLLTLQQQMTYDTHGNLISETMRKYSSNNSLTTSYLYDAKGRLIQKTDPMGLVSQIAYNDLGRVATTTDIRGEETHYTYDSFGREISALLPDTTVRSTSRTWTSEGTNGLFAITQMQTNKPTTKTIYDALGREVRKSDLRFDSIYRNIDRLYNEKGLLYQVSLPKRGGDPSLWNTYSYDGHNRITSIAEASGRTTTYSYDGLSKTTTENGITTTRTYDALGALVSVTDPAGTILYNLNADGSPLSITAPGNITTTFTYDTYGRKTSISDPSAGTTTYEYDDDGNLSSETDANSETIEYTYDQYGRLTEKDMPEFSTTYTYNNFNELTAVTSDNDTSKEYIYDSHGRVSMVRESIDDKFLQKDIFNSLGQTDSIRYSSHAGYLATEIYEYANGYIRRGLLNGGREVFELNGENNWGNPTHISLKQLICSYGYTSYGTPTSKQIIRSLPVSKGPFHPSLFVEDFTYSFDVTTGNLLSRTDANRSITETFTYDEQNRLATYNGESITYEDNGNIEEIEDAGWQEYETPGKAYAVSDAGIYNNLSSDATQDITYTSFKRPSRIQEGNGVTLFTYDDAGNRKLMTTISHHKSLPRSSWKRYMGECYESKSSTPSISVETEYLYLFGNYYNAPAVLVKNNDTDSLFYILRDYQGSITCITREDGSLRSEQSYDVWGRLRNPATHAVYSYSDQPTLFLERGYTGHEHLTRFGLINMNARLYDPAIGRFLSPDPYVQAPENTQSFNRYSYCLNNPLRYTDKSGELFIFDDWLWGGIKGLINGGNFWKSANQSAKNALKIWGGLFTLDSNKTFGEKLGELFSRFSWQLPQTVLGFSFAHFTNAFYEIENIDYMNGATVIASNIFNSGAITLGNFISGVKYIRGSLKDDTFKHEYGHYLQSQDFGWAYLLCVGIPSLKSAKNNDETHYETAHRNKPYEVDANIRAESYFRRYYPDAPAWNSKVHPLESELGTTVTNQWWHYPTGFLAVPLFIPLSVTFNTFIPFIGAFQ